MPTPSTMDKSLALPTRKHTSKPNQSLSVLDRKLPPTPSEPNTPLNLPPSPQRVVSPARNGRSQSARRYEGRELPNIPKPVEEIRKGSASSIKSNINLAKNAPKIVLKRPNNNHVTADDTPPPLPPRRGSGPSTQNVQITTQQSYTNVNLARQLPPPSSKPVSSGKDKPSGLESRFRFHRESDFPEPDDYNDCKKTYSSQQALKAKAKSRNVPKE